MLPRKRKMRIAAILIKIKDGAVETNIHLTYYLSINFVHFLIIATLYEKNEFEHKISVKR